MEEMQGIMSLPQPTGVDPEQFAVFEEMRTQVPPAEFGNTLLDSASEADPEAVAAFREALSSIRLPMEALELLNEMVDAVLKSPRDYASLRRYYMTRGLTEDVLPERFDPLFFSALNLALDQVVPQSEPMAMAGGGIADLAQYGRFGDTMLAHITPEEAALLKARGGSGTINPVTGLPEFFLKDLFKGIGKAIKSFAKSTVGKIITTIALGYFLGPAAASFLGVSSTAGVAAIGGFVGSAGSSLLAGEGFKNALKAGTVGALTAGALAGITGGAEAFASGSYTGPTTVSGQFDKLVSPAQAAGAEAAAEAATEQIVSGPAPIEDVSGKAVFVERAPFSQPISLEDQSIVSPIRPPEVASRNIFTGAEVPTSQGTAPQGPVPQGPVPQGPVPQPAPVSAGFDFAPGAPVGSPPQPAPVSAGFDFAPGAPIDSPPQAFPAGSPNARPDLEFAFEKEFGRALEPRFPPPQTQGYSDLLRQGKFAEAGQKAYDQFMPESLGGKRGIPTETAIRDKITQARQNVTVKNPDLAVKAISSDPHSQVFEKLVEAEARRLATPGIISTYGPLALAATGVAAAAGAFKPTKAAVPDLSKFDLANYYKPLGPFTLAPSRPYRPTIARPRANPINVAPRAKGGIMSLEMDGVSFPRKQGAINGPGTGTSDSIPALLSDGEFVFTAKAVRGMGQGSRRKGAKRLYSLMKMLEERKG